MSLTSFVNKFTSVLTNIMVTANADRLDFKASDGIRYHITRTHYNPVVFTVKKGDDHSEMQIQVNNLRECVNEIERRIGRVSFLKTFFKENGKKKNAADSSDFSILANQAEKTVINNCCKQNCTGCEMGWICPKFNI